MKNKIIDTKDIYYKDKAFYTTLSGRELRIAWLWSRINPYAVIDIITETCEGGASGGWFKISTINDTGLFLTKRRKKWMINSIACFYNDYASSVELAAGVKLTLMETIRVLNSGIK